MLVKDIMQKEVLTLPPHTTLREAAEFMLQHDASTVPVVEEEAHFVGMISFKDILRAPLATLLHSQVGNLSPYNGLAQYLDATPVFRLMRSTPWTVQENLSVSHVLSHMLSLNLSLVPVVKEERLVGVVTRSALIRAVLEIAS